MNIQMKQRYILPALLLLCAACQQEEWAQPEADSSDAIRFAAPTITVEELTRSTFHDAFPTGGTFGVLGYCVPYQRGSDTEMDWASGRQRLPRRVLQSSRHLQRLGLHL